MSVAARETVRDGVRAQPAADGRSEPMRAPRRATHVALLTGGNDKHYAVALAAALVQAGVTVDFVASSDLDCPEVRVPGITFLDLRGDQREDVPFSRKALRVLRYYLRLIGYAATCRPAVFHILWNNKFEMVDRVLLMLYYRALGKHVMFTAHNVNAAKRDDRDTWLNRVTLRIQYRLCSRIFAHTELMKRQLIEEFGVRAERVVVIPYGINVTLPAAGLTRAVARARLGLGPTDRVLLFFGQIAPYKGLEYLVEALALLAGEDPHVRVLIAGKVKQGWGEYWSGMRQLVAARGVGDRVVEHVRFIPDEEIEPFYAAADALVLPYTYIFQSGVLFMAFSFGVPVVATDVGSLKEFVREGDTGFVCRPKDPADLAAAIRRFFASPLYTEPEIHRRRIRALADEQHSWATVADITAEAYLKN